MKVLWKECAPIAVVEQRGINWYCIESWSNEIYVSTDPLIDVTQYCKDHKEWHVKDIDEPEYALITLTCKKRKGEDMI